MNERKENLDLEFTSIARPQPNLKSYPTLIYDRVLHLATSGYTDTFRYVENQIIPSQNSDWYGFKRNRDHFVQNPNWDHLFIEVNNIPTQTISMQWRFFLGKTIINSDQKKL